MPKRRDGELNIDVREMAYLWITYDHRIVDGVDAARFLTTITSRPHAGTTQRISPEKPA